MAHETLKATIRQYIGPNGQNSITGQIMQDILIAMVDEYPDISGYATQSWVTSQGYLIPGSRISLLGNDVGYLTSADLSGYATTSQLAGYLPLTGGTMTGDLNMAAYKLYFGTPYIYESTIPGPQGTNMGHILQFAGVDGYGYYGFDNSVHATSFVKANGTSTQFLKADGSVDENTYLIPGSRISLLGNDVGYLTSADLSGYATTSQLAGYLPLTGGTMTGDLNMAAYKLYFGTPYIYESTIPGPQGTNMGHILQFAGVDGYGYYGFDNSVHATSFVKANGTSTQFLKADGSVDGNSYLLSSGGTITGNLTVGGILIASSGNLHIFGGNAVVFEVQNSLDVMFNGGFEYFFDAKITAPAFNNTSDLRKKTITGDVLMNLYNVANAPLFKFTWKDEKKYSGEHIGSAAQYWQTVLPELVSIGRDVDMTLAMQYDVIALASAITVAKTVVDHETRIRQLEEKIK